MLTNDGKQSSGDYKSGSGEIVDFPHSGPESTKVGYETTDVNVGGVIVFLGGLFGFVLIFFLFCFFMGKTINEALKKGDGPEDKWHHGQGVNASGNPENGPGQKRENLKSNASMEQQELQQVTSKFPSPRLDIDDGNQATADLHAREDLLLEHYSSIPGQTGIRIPIEQAMQLIAQKGLPVAPTVQTSRELAEDKKPAMQLPLTSGFARTGYELDTIEAREQKMAYGKASSSAHAELKPVR